MVETCLTSLLTLKAIAMSLYHIVGCDVLLAVWVKHTTVVLLVPPQASSGEGGPVGPESLMGVDAGWGTENDLVPPTKSRSVKVQPKPLLSEGRKVCLRTLHMCTITPTRPFVPTLTPPFVPTPTPPFVPTPPLLPTPTPPFVPTPTPPSVSDHLSCPHL